MCKCTSILYYTIYTIKYVFICLHICAQMNANDSFGVTVQNNGENQSDNNNFGVKCAAVEKCKINI